MKKILHISKFYYPYFGGIEDVAHSIVTELTPYFEQRIICFNHERGTTCDFNNPQILRVGILFSVASQPISLYYRSLLKKTINEFKPDFIHIHLPNPLIASYLLTLNLYNAKIIVHWHADVLGQKFLHDLYRPFEKKILLKSHKIIVTSEVYGDYSTALRDYKNKTVILPNIVNEEKLHLFTDDEKEIKKIKERYSNKKIVLFIGRHVPYKGIDLLIEAERFIKEDCVILIAGAGNKTSELKKKAKDTNRIKFIGRLSNKELKNYLYAATVFAFPSINRKEAFGVALAEALYCGVPAVSFNIEGSGAIWVNKNNYTGFVVENRNVEKFGTAIDKLLALPELHSKFSKNAITWVKKNFLKEQIVEKTKDIYD